METNFFETNSYFVDEKVKVLQFNNIYKIYNDQGVMIGSIVQKLTSGEKFQRLFLSKSILPFHLEIRDSKDQLLATISRGWTFIMSKTLIQDPKGNITGTIQQVFKFFKPTFVLFNKSNDVQANITGNWRARKFVIKNSFEIQIAYITKKWAGLAREMFTTSDKYLVEIEPKYSSDESKLAILSCAINIDMVYKSKNNE